MVQKKEEEEEEGEEKKISDSNILKLMPFAQAFKMAERSSTTIRVNEQFCTRLD